jgi:hypothetical protein
MRCRAGSEEEERGLTFIVVIVDQFLSCYHVEKLKDPTFLQIIRSGAGKHRHGIDTHLQAGSLRGTNTGSANFDRTAGQIHAVETLDGDAGNSWVDILTECNPLDFQLARGRSLFLRRILTLDS